MNLKDKVVVITGGASGLGQATARYMVNEKGAKVTLLDLNAEAGAETVAELGEGSAIFCQTDVTSEESIDTAIAVIMDKFGAIHVDINAAGIPLPCKILDRDGVASSLAKYATVINVNLMGVFNVMAKCAEQMAKNEPDEKGERGTDRPERLLGLQGRRERHEHSRRAGAGPSGYPCQFNRPGSFWYPHGQVFRSEGAGRPDPDV